MVFDKFRKHKLELSQSLMEK